MSLKKDILILGAGAAGLSCAHQLVENGFKNIALLEARSRIGGRALTQKSKYDVVELGAEFIHGAPKSTLDLLQKHRLPFLNVTNSHFHVQGGQFEEYDFDRIVATFQSRLEPKRDLPIAQFLNLQKDIRLEDRLLMQNFISGFHAADVNVMGEKAWAESGAANEGSLNGVDMFRLPLGYTNLMNHLLPKEILLLKNTVIQKISWQPGKVLLEDHHGHEWQAKRVVITVPLGVLKSGAITFDPVPKELTEALAGLRMGHIQRLVFRFGTRFWERLSPHPIGFLQSATLDFPVWWTSSPLRAPYLTAWQGGPRAEEMAKLPLKERAHIALKTLAEMGGFSIEEVRSECKEVWNHNWSLDPFSQGAYSYIAHGAADRWRILQNDVEQTLYFAGEAWVEGAARGTVHGAFHSGAEVADRILRHASETRPS